MVIKVWKAEGWPMRRSTSLGFTSGVNGHAYRLGVSTPLTAPPAAGHPVLFTLDGDANFGTASEAARGQAMFGEAVDAALVVAIGYATEDVREILRNRYGDLTTPAPPEPMAESDPYFGAQSGGMDAFLTVIFDEIISLVAEHFPIDLGRLALFGHSLGGLTALRAMFTRPDAFQSVMASSPSLHWNQRAIFTEADRFLSRALTGDRRPSLLLSVGSLEDGAFPMTANARDMAQRLRPTVGGALRRMSLRVFDDENHESVTPCALSRAVRFAFSRTPAGA